MEEKVIVKIPANTKLWVMAIAIGLLILISGVQAVQLVSLKNRVNTELSNLKASEPVSTTSSGALQKDVQSLPSMVGGC